MTTTSRYGSSRVKSAQPQEAVTMRHNSQIVAAGIAVFLLGSACAGQYEVPKQGPPSQTDPPDAGPVPVPVPAPVPDPVPPPDPAPDPAPPPVARFVEIADAVPL